MKQPDLELAAYLGDGEAASTLGVQAAPGAESDFAAWAWELCRWGQETMVRASLAAARFALPGWENYQPKGEHDRDIVGPQLRILMDAIDAHLAARPGADTELAEALTQAHTLFERTDFIIDEFVGYGGRAKKMYAALLATLAALEAAVWSEASVREWGAQFSVDEAEIAARVEAGPALQTVRALSEARDATDATVPQILAELRRVLL